MSARRRAGRLGPTALLALTAWAGTPQAGAAQDIETLGALRGVPVPEGYYERLRADPTAFTLPHGLFRTTPDGRLAARSEGVARLPVILALFADSEEPHITRDVLQQRLFDGPSERGTITEAYDEISRGALEVTGTVFDWVRTSITMAAAVGTGNGLGEDANLGPWFLSALEQVDPGVDFGLYDSDGPDGVPNSGDDDGFVDAMTFEYLEVAGSCGGPSIWPHRWRVSAWNDGQAFETDDLRPDGSPVIVDGYIVQSVAGCDGVTPQDANVISHEFGHVLGLPDYYHPTASGGAVGRRWVLGCWSLMAAGSWGCGPVGSERAPFGPTHMNIRSKNVLGWADFTDVDGVWDEEFVLEPVQTSGRGLRIPLDEIGREFLLIEYRAQHGFDHQIPADGVLIYHQDFEGSLRPDPASVTPYFLALVEQDDDNGLQRNTFEGGDRGMPGDAWGVNGLSGRLNGQTVPSTRPNSGGASSVAIHEVVVEDGVARLRISSAPTPRIIAPGAPVTVQQVAPFDVRVRVGGGRSPYEALGTPPEGWRIDVFGDELIVTGSTSGTEPVEVLARVREARGAQSEEVAITVVGGAEWTVSAQRLLQSFLRSDVAPLAPPEADHVDALGNANGRLDVGDLRRWLFDAELQTRVQG